MRDAGFIQKIIWIPNVRSSEYRARIDREIAAIASADPAGEEALDWMSRLFDWSDKSGDGTPR
jgi:hypothetical protein